MSKFRELVEATDLSVPQIAHTLARAA